MAQPPGALELHQLRWSPCWQQGSARPQATDARESGPVRFGVYDGDTSDEDDPPGAASARLKALGLVDRRGLGIREKVDQRLCCDWLL